MTQERKIIVANWKMNTPRQQVVEDILTPLMADIDASGFGHVVSVVICPPFPYLPTVATMLARSHFPSITLGAQDLSRHAQGPHTGEVSAAMLADLNCQWVIIGHSERRQGHGEDEPCIAAKCQHALREGLSPIVCVGETLQQRERGEVEAVITAQLDGVLASGAGTALPSLAIAYEPIWAIGTGRSATAEQIEQVHTMIRSQLGNHDPDWARSVPVLYGGSVTGDNVQSLCNCRNVNGALVGGASLHPRDFFLIIQRAAEALPCKH